MMDVIITIFMWIAGIATVALVVGLWAFMLFVINEDANQVFKHRRNDRFANKLFNKIEEYRRDFS